MKKTNKKNLILYCSLSVLFVGLMLIGTFYDLQISNAIADLPSGGYLSTNVFGKIFEIIGEMPLYIIVSFAAAMIFHNLCRRKKTKLTLIFKIFTIVVAFGMFYYMSYKLFGYLSDHFDFANLLDGIASQIAYALIGACLTFALFYFSKSLSSDFLNKVLVWSVIIFATALLSQLLTNILKIFAGRPRYRAMSVLQDFEMFKKWFEFQGSTPEIPEEWRILYDASSGWFKSFPSGHTSAGSLVVVLVAIPTIFSDKLSKPAKIIIDVAVVAYIACVMLSRIIVGAHFLTDVTFGCFITVISYLVSDWAIKKLFNKIKVAPLQIKALPRIEETSVE